MQENKTPIIAIIGGGFCGMVTAVHLMQQAHKPLKAIIINSSFPFGKGIAYGAHTNAYLLNVRAINMSAFPEQQQHFVQWLQVQKEYENVAANILPNVYIPRKKYGEYLAAIWQEALLHKPGFIDVEIMEDYAEDINKEKDQYTIHLKSGTTVLCDVVVLATGNSQPNQHVAGNNAVLENKNYYGNPWSKECIANVQSLCNILIIGNGLTMIDTVLGLAENGFSGTVHTISPHGFALLPHKYNLLVYDKLVKELPEKFSLHALLSLTHAHAKSLAAIGIGEHLVTDSLRPLSSAIWQGFSLREKNIFLKKISHIWNAYRHRIPLHIFERIQQMRISSKLCTHEGTIANAALQNNDTIKVLFENRQSQTKEEIIVERIINCTGPQANITQCSNTLLKNLFAAKMIAPDPLYLGINADAATGAVINAEGNSSNTMFTIGGNLRGILWETNAVPELRVQAAQLAKEILNVVE